MDIPHPVDYPLELYYDADWLMVTKATGSMFPSKPQRWVPPLVMDDHKYVSPSLYDCVYCNVSPPLYDCMYCNVSPPCMAVCTVMCHPPCMAVCTVMCHPPCMTVCTVM